ANPSRGRRALVRSSAPAGYARCPECKSSLRPHSSAARAPLCAMPSSVSSASVCTRECTRRASPGSPPARATSSSSGPLHVPSLPVAKTSAQSSLYRAQEFSLLPQGAHTKSRECSPVLKGLLRIRRYHQQETPYALQEGELFSWLQFGEAYSACGAGAPFRPLFCPIPSCIVPGPKIIPFQLNGSPQPRAAPLRAKSSLTNIEV